MSDTLNAMVEHELNPVKGWWDEHSLDKSADLSIAEGKTAYAGMVVSLNVARKFQLGLGCGDVAIFLRQNSYDFDVVGDTGGLVGSGNGQPTDGAPVPRMSGLVALGPFELQSTEFDVGQADAYLPNTPLTAGAPGAADAGVIQPGEAYVDTICGVVSDGVITNEHGVEVLQFWTAWLPPTDGCPDESSESLT